MITVYNQTSQRITIADNEEQAASLPIEAGCSMAVCWHIESLFIAASRDDLNVTGYELGEAQAQIVVSELAQQEWHFQ